jgi:hypothetical protein
MSNRERLATARLVVVSRHHKPKYKFRQIFPKISLNFRYLPVLQGLRCTVSKEVWKQFEATFQANSQTSIEK